MKFRPPCVMPCSPKARRISGLTRWGRPLPMSTAAGFLIVARPAVVWGAAITRRRADRASTRSTGLQTLRSASSPDFRRRRIALAAVPAVSGYIYPWNKEGGALILPRQDKRPSKNLVMSFPEQ